MTSELSLQISGLRTSYKSLKSNLLLLAICATSISASAVFAAGGQTIGAAIDAGFSGDAHSRLIQIEKRRQDIQKKKFELRKKREIVIKHIHEIDKKLDVTKTVLHVHTAKLAKTETKITQTQQVIEKTQETTDDVATAASKRLREIFEGQRISFLEMMLQVDSLPTMLDRFYFQERV